MKRFYSFLSLFVVAFVILHATPLDDKVKAFDDAIKASSRAPIAGLNPGTGSRLMQGIDASAYPGGEANLEMMVRQTMATNPSKAVQEAGEALISEIEKERADRLRQVTAKIKAVLSRLPPLFAQAQKPVDLDAILGDIQAATPTGGGAYDPDIQAEVNHANAVYQFVAQWQDYLSQRSSGNNQEALNSLRNLLSQRPPGEAVLPRSQVLALITNLESQLKIESPVDQNAMANAKIVPVLDGIKTLDDLEPAARRVATLTNVPSYEISELGQLALLYSRSKNGLPFSLDLNSPNYGVSGSQPELSRIESMVLSYVLPRFLGSGAPAFTANESVSDYLDRVIAEAEAMQNWLLLQRVIDAKMKIARTTSVPTGVQSFLAGLTQEMAGQYALAVSSYESALRMPDDFEPVKVIGDRLAAIKKDQPSGYDEGMKNFLHPPQPAYSPVPYGYNPYASRFGLSGYPPNPPPGIYSGFQTPPAPSPTPAPVRADPKTSAPPTAPSTNASTGAPGPTAK